MLKHPLPPAKMAFVCTHTRPEGHPKPCCGRRGGPELRATLREMAEERGLQFDVKILQSGCLGGCEFGPVVMTTDDRLLRFQIGDDEVGTILDEMTSGS